MQELCGRIEVGKKRRSFHPGLCPVSGHFLKHSRCKDLTVFKYPMKGVLRVSLNELNILLQVLTDVWPGPFIAQFKHPDCFEDVKDNLSAS